MISEHGIPGRLALEQLASLSDCDVIIINYNAGVVLTECVADLVSSTIRSIIVVDNASKDGSLALLETSLKDSRLKVFRNASNLGFAAACNMGARISSSRYLLFLNPDCLLTPTALLRLLTVINSADDIGMVGGLLINPDGSEQQGGRRFFPTPGRALVNTFGLYALANALPKHFSDFSMHREPLPRHPTQVEAISGACMLVKRVAVDDVGLWDEKYFLHCEDLDWCMRFRQKGWKIMFVSDVRVVHHKGVCSKSRPIFVEWHKHKGMIRFYRKFFRQQYPTVLMWLVFLGVWLRFSAVATYHGMRQLGYHLGMVHE